MADPRIIAGSAKGLRLLPVPGDTTRPVTDRVKEALFNIIGADLRDARFLDLFGGTGSIGIEALSRGAAFVQFVELHQTVVNVLKENIRRSRLADRAAIHTGDAFRFLQTYTGEPFHYIYIAPPQYKDMWLAGLTLIDQNPELLAYDGWAIVQIHPVEYEDRAWDNLEPFDSRKYGSTRLVFYQRKEDQGSSNEMTISPASL